MRMFIEMPSIHMFSSSNSFNDNLGRENKKSLPWWWFEYWILLHFSKILPMVTSFTSINPKWKKKRNKIIIDQTVYLQMWPFKPAEEKVCFSRGDWWSVKFLTWEFAHFYLGVNGTRREALLGDTWLRAGLETKKNSPSQFASNS